jgi:hypothetical protein
MVASYLLLLYMATTSDKVRCQAIQRVIDTKSLAPGCTLGHERKSYAQTSSSATVCTTLDPSDLVVVVVVVFT